VLTQAKQAKTMKADEGLTMKDTMNETMNKQTCHHSLPLISFIHACLDQRA
jgi:hypothetical protein